MNDLSRIDKVAAIAIVVVLDVVAVALLCVLTSLIFRIGY